MLFSYKDEDTHRFSNLHSCTFKVLGNDQVYKQRLNIIGIIQKRFPKLDYKSSVK